MTICRDPSCPGTSCDGRDRSPECGVRMATPDYALVELRLVVTEALQNAVASGYADELRQLSDESLCCDLYDTCEPVELWLIGRLGVPPGQEPDDMTQTPGWGELRECVTSVRRLLLGGPAPADELGKMQAGAPSPEDGRR